MGNNNTNNLYKETVDEIARSVAYMLQQQSLGNTQIYNGILINFNSVKVNDKVYSLSQYGGLTHQINDVVKVFIPQGNMNLAFFI